MAGAAALTAVGACEVFGRRRQDRDGEGQRTGRDGIQRLGRKEVRLRWVGGVKSSEINQRICGIC